MVGFLGSLKTSVVLTTCRIAQFSIAEDAPDGTATQLTDVMRGLQVKF